MKEHPWGIERFTNHIRVQAAQKHLMLCGNETDGTDLPEDDPNRVYAWACLDSNLDLSIQFGKFSDGINCRQIAASLLWGDTERDVINGLYCIYEVWAQEMD